MKIVWTEIITEEDIGSFMQVFGGFHDSCLKEMKYISGAFVGKELSMNPVNNMRIVDMVFQRQYKNPMAVALRFIGINELHLTPCNEDYTCEITDAKIFIKNGLFYWADCGGEEIEACDGTWICADKIQ